MAQSKNRQFGAGFGLFVVFADNKRNVEYLQTSSLFANLQWFFLSFLSKITVLTGKTSGQKLVVFTAVEERVYKNASFI